MARKCILCGGVLHLPRKKYCSKCKPNKNGRAICFEEREERRLDSEAENNSPPDGFQTWKEWDES